MKRNRVFFVLLLVFSVVICERLQAQTLQVKPSPDKTKVNRSARNGIATIFFDSNIEDLKIICTDQNPNEQVIKDENDDSRWYVKIDVKKDLDEYGFCERIFLLKCSTSAEYQLKIDSIAPNQVLYYTVFLPEIAGGVPLRVNASFENDFDNGDFPENVMGLLITLPGHRRGLNSRNKTITIYRNLKDNKYDQLYNITPQGIINNINIGDVLTLIPDTMVFNSVSIIITDTILNTNELKCFFSRKKHTLHGYVIDEYSHQPVQNCVVGLYLGSVDDKYKDYWGETSTYMHWGWGYERYFDGGESIADYLTEINGYFGWKDCIIDYTYYVTAEPPKGYSRIGYNNGINIKPIDNTNDSLLIWIKPIVINGIVTDGKNAISNAEIECKTLYGTKHITTGADGRFELIGPTSEFVRFKHADYRAMDVKFDELYFRDNGIITITMRKGKDKTSFRGIYKWGKIKEIK